MQDRATVEMPPATDQGHSLKQFSDFPIPKHEGIIGSHHPLPVGTASDGDCELPVPNP